MQFETMPHNVESDARTFALCPTVRGTSEEFNSLALIGDVKNAMENFIDAKHMVKVEDNVIMNATKHEREEALNQFLAESIGEVICRRGLHEVGICATLIHKHYDVQNNWLQVTRKEHDDEGREVYVATPTNVSDVDEPRNLVPLKWRLVVDKTAKQLHFEAWEFIDVSSLDSISAAAYRRAANEFETDFVSQRELAEVMLKTGMHQLFGVGTGMFPVLRTGQDIAMELNDVAGAQSRLTVIRAKKLGLNGYWEHPQYIKTARDFAEQTINTVWTFTRTETRVNGIVTYKCSGCTHICVCVNCS